MPYTIKKTDNEYCVHKANADGTPMGESLGCHSTRKEAAAQIGAIEKSEKKAITLTLDIDMGEIVDAYTKSEPEPVLPEEIDMSTKAQLMGEPSAEDRQMAVYDAWREYRNGDWSSHVVECYDDYVIIWDSNQKTHFQVGCDMSGDDITFAPMNEWVEVKLQAEWITKSIELLGLQDLVVVQLPQVPDQSYAIKTLGGNRIGAYGILWGDEEHRDLHTEYFTPDTKDIKAIFDVMGAVPNIVHHGVDDEVEKFVIGAVDVMEPDDKGVWWESKIKEFESYRKYVEPLMAEKALFSSSGTLPGAKRVNKETGEITRWPVAEMTGTWIPAEYRMLENPISDIKLAFKTIGIEFNEDVINVDPEEAAAKAKGVEKARLERLIQQGILNVARAELELL